MENQVIALLYLLWNSVNMISAASPPLLTSISSTSLREHLPSLQVPHSVNIQTSNTRNVNPANLSGSLDRNIFDLSLLFYEMTVG